LAPSADDKARIVCGLEGFDRTSVKVWMQGCPVRADQAPLQPAQQPVPHAIVVREVFGHLQVRTPPGGHNAALAP